MPVKGEAEGFRGKSRGEELGVLEAEASWLWECWEAG